MLIAQLSNITSVRPGDVENAIDLMMEAVRGLSAASRGALLEGPPGNRKIIRSWCEDGDEHWVKDLLSNDPDARASRQLVFFDLADETHLRTLVLSSKAEADRSLIDAVGFPTRQCPPLNNP